MTHYEKIQEAASKAIQRQEEYEIAGRAFADLLLTEVARHLGVPEGRLVAIAPPPVEGEPPRTDALQLRDDGYFHTHLRLIIAGGGQLTIAVRFRKQQAQWEVVLGRGGLREMINPHMDPWASVAADLAHAITKCFEDALPSYLRGDGRKDVGFKL